METAKKKELQALAVKIRMAALEAIHSLGSGHLGGALCGDGLPGPVVEEFERPVAGRAGRRTGEELDVKH